MARCPLFPGKQTLVKRSGMSASCQKQTLALQQKTYGLAREHTVRRACCVTVIEGVVLTCTAIP
jgi:hypothetical protein